MKIDKVWHFFLSLGSEEEERNRKIRQKNLRGVGRHEGRSKNWKKGSSERTGGFGMIRKSVEGERLKNNHCTRVTANRTAKNFINTEEVRGLLRTVPFMKVPWLK